MSGGRSTGGCGLRALLLGLIAAGTLFVAPVAFARVGSTVRIGLPPALPAGTRPLAVVAGGQVIRVTVALAPRDPVALASYAAAVADPASPLYRHYLRPRGFARRFGPRPAALAAVDASLRAHGLLPGRVSANGLAIPVRAAAARLERAFSTTLTEVRLPSGADAVVNAAAPAVDRGIAREIQAIVGLSSLLHPQPALSRRVGVPGSTALSGSTAFSGRSAAFSGRSAAFSARSAGHVATGGPQPCAAASGAAASQSAYTADQIASAYDFPGLYRAGDEGQGATIAVYELEPDAPSDIAAYQSCYGTHATVSYVPVDGGAGSGPGSGEAALDIEQLIGLAPRAHLVVYQGPNSTADSPGSGPYDTDSAIVSQDIASVVSTSWGECEPIEGSADAAAENTLFEEAAVQGQTFVSAAGDSGSEDCDQPAPAVPDTELAVDDPASQPFVTGVGGTSLSPPGSSPRETAWNNGGNLGGLLGFEPGAGGGGISQFWSMPAYQANAGSALHVTNGYSSGVPCHAGTGDCRQVPDVSADANPATGYIIYYNGSGQDMTSPRGWQGTGGTSAAAPLWAALFALADASSACRSSALGFVDPALYRLAGADQGAYFYDITAGNNDFTGTAGGRYPATVGYDMATGLGTPRAAALAPALCGGALRLRGPASQRTFRGRRVALSVQASDARDAGLRFLASGLPAGLSLNRSTGRIAGRVRAVGVWHPVLEALDRAGDVRSVRFTWTVDAPPSVRTGRLGGLAVGRPTFFVRFASGRYEAPLTAIVLELPAGLRLTGDRRAVALTGPGGHRLTARLLGGGRRLIVRLAAASPVVRIAFGRRSLSASRELVLAAGARRSPLLRLAVRTTDGDGQSASGTRALRS